ncbi:hypothetical protein LWI29_001775 [Acer saccharum]|uniref:Cupin type-1 domain-containing protein n=1 Tax=Acer saccharum TaxID=4024 RepID=A0AA39W211_ACESA|nr:hypothetical protein LWI29_001775 [Acer saccharum]
MDMELSPKSSKLMFEGEGGSYYSWSSPVLGDAKVGAGLLVLKPGGFALPHYADCSKVGYVLQGEVGVAALVSPNGDKKEETVLGLEAGDVIPVPSGSTSWWYNHGNSSVDVIIVFLGETANAYIPGQFTYFFLTGARGILAGFSTEIITRAYNINQEQANILAKTQTGFLIVKLDPDQRKNIPQPHQNIVNNWVKNITKHLPDIRVDKAGTITSFTGKNFSFLDQVGLSCSIVKLEAHAMLSPIFTTDFSVQVFYVAKGSGHVQIVGLNSKLVLDIKIVVGQLLVVPRFFTVAIIAQAQGMECFSITTSSRPVEVADFAKSEIPKSIALPSCPSYPDTSQPDRSSSPSSRLVAAVLSCRHCSPRLTVFSSVSGCWLQGRTVGYLLSNSWSTCGPGNCSTLKQKKEQPRSSLSLSHPSATALSLSGSCELAAGATSAAAPVTFSSKPGFRIQKIATLAHLRILTCGWQ